MKTNNNVYKTTCKLQAHNRLVAELDMLGLEVVETQSFTTDVTDALWKLRNKDVRVILGNFNESWARRVFCEAFRQEYYCNITCSTNACIILH